MRSEKGIGSEMQIATSNRVRLRGGTASLADHRREGLRFPRIVIGTREDLQSEKPASEKTE